MTERIRAEITEDLGNGMATTYAAEALSRADAVDTVIELMEREEAMLDDD